LHTIKGSGAMFGFDELAGFSHNLENAFDEVRNGRLLVTPELIDLSLAALDQIRTMLDEAAGRGEAVRSTSIEILAKLRRFTGKPDPHTEAAAPATPGSSPLVPAPVVRHWHIRFSPGADLMRGGTNPLLLLRELKQLGTLQIKASMAAIPPIDELDPERCYLSWDLSLATSAAREAISDVFIFVADSCELRIEPTIETTIAAAVASKAATTVAAVAGEVSSPVAGQSQTPKAKNPPWGRRASDTPDNASSIRVPAAKLDQFVNLAFVLICDRLRGDGNSHPGVAEQLPSAYAGLTIQLYQMRTIKEIVAGWASQIKTCMAGILRVSTSEVLGIAPLVLEQEKNVSLQLARIERLEDEGRIYSERIQFTLGGLSHLTQLVSEHVERSKSIRDRLRMLAFNSIIEASHLGTKANVILAISTSIKEISLAWSEITNQSAAVMRDLLILVKQTNQVMEAFSEANNARLHEAQVETRAALDNLRSAAEFAARQAQEMKFVTETMQAKSARVGDTGDRLEACFGRFDAVLAAIEDARYQLEVDWPGVQKRYDTVEVERLFSASYTTELERDVLRAALRGKAMPVAQQTFAGNSVELF